jgi:predicted phage terminase large subunit-like protein
MQQNVLSKGGAVFNVSRLRFIDELNPMPKKFDKIVRFWDRAATSAEDDADACYTAGVAIGMIGEDKFYFINVKRGQWNWTDVENEMGATMSQDTAQYGWSTVMTVFEREPAASGKQVAEMTVRKFRQFQIYAYHPTANKGVRAQPLGAAMERYEVWVDPTEPWYLDWVTELQSFTVLDGGFKDQADASGGAYNELVFPSEDVSKFYTPQWEKGGEEQFPAYGSNSPCLREGCRRPAFAGAATGGYCCACCAEDKAHTVRCNGEYTDWYVTARNSL